jgi:hypothetical protein
VDIRLNGHRFRRAIEGAIGLECGQVKPGSMQLVVHPHGVGLGVFLLLFAGCFGVARPNRQPFSIGRERKTAYIQRQRLRRGPGLFFRWLWLLLLVGAMVICGGGCSGRWRNCVGQLRFIDCRHGLEVERRSFAAAHIQAKELRLLVSLG